MTLDLSKLDALDKKRTPCPFCGRDNIDIYERRSGRRYFYCVDCEAEGPSGKDNDDAAVRWDRRRLEAPSEEGWQPIESAPKQSRETIHAYSTSGNHWLVHWDGKNWRDDIGANTLAETTLTHWRPLPSPPRQDQEG